MAGPPTNQGARYERFDFICNEGPPSFLPVPREACFAASVRRILAKPKGK